MNTKRQGKSATVYQGEETLGSSDGRQQQQQQHKHHYDHIGSEKGSNNMAQQEEDAELEELRRVRRALSKMNHGIENIQQQMKYFKSNISQTTQLLDIWVRILSQTAHNQAFLANDEWQGSSMDTAKLNDLVQRDRVRQEEAERRARESEMQRERLVAEARERERLRAEMAAAAESVGRQQHGTRPGIIPGRRPPPGPAARGRGARGSARGRGRGREGASTSSSFSSATGSRIRPPR